MISFLSPSSRGNSKSQSPSNETQQENLLVQFKSNCLYVVLFPGQSRNPCPSHWPTEREKTWPSSVSLPPSPLRSPLPTPRSLTVQWSTRSCRDTSVWRRVSMSSCASPWSCHVGSRRRWTGETGGIVSSWTPHQQVLVLVSKWWFDLEFLDIQRVCFGKCVYIYPSCSESWMKKFRMQCI